MQGFPRHHFLTHVGLAGLSSLALFIGLGTAPSIASDKNSRFLLAQGIRTNGPINFAKTPELCRGQVLGNGWVCVTDMSATEGLGKRVAIMINVFTDPNTNFTILTTTKVVEMLANKANISYAAFVDATTLPNHISPDKFERPLLFLKIRNDGAVSVNENYGKYPPNLDQKEETSRLFRLHKDDIQKLVTVLAQKRS